MCIDLSDRIQNGCFTNSDGFTPGQGIRFGSLDFIAHLAGRLTPAATFIEGQVFHLGSVDFIADDLGKLCIRDLALSQSVKN